VVTQPTHRFSTSVQSSTELEPVSQSDQQQKEYFMRIKPGTPAPHFDTQDAFGTPIALEDYKGKWLLLSFMRNGACAICNLRVHELIERFPILQQHKLEIVTVFESPALSIQQYVGKQDAPFPIVPDPQAKLYELYGLETSEEKVNATMTRAETSGIIQQAAANGFELTPEEGSNFFRMPADFLIGPDLTVRTAHYAEYVYDHLGFDKLEQALLTAH
jgi:thioredoxin-dependent peroxiredoxin